MKLVAIPPWEEITYFQTPKVSVFELTFAGGWAEIAGANPNRVVLMVASSAQCNLTPDNSISTTGGIVLPGAGLPLVLREATDGPLCSSAWFASPASGGEVITVIEVILREFPGAT